MSKESVKVTSSSFVVPETVRRQKLSWCGQDITDLDSRGGGEDTLSVLRLEIVKDESLDRRSSSEGC